MRDDAGDVGRPRLAAVDRVRGLALAVIMIENVAFYAVSRDGEDGLLRSALALTVDHRGLPLFCLLLGWGVAARRARGVPPAELRRLAAVWIGLGALNALLFFPGDILVAYGVLLLILLPLVYRRPMSRAAGGGLVALFAVSCVVTAALLVWGDSSLRYEQLSFAASTWSGALEVRSVEAAAALLALPLVIAGLLLPTALGFASWATTAGVPGRWGAVLPRASAGALLVVGGMLCVPRAVGFLVDVPATWAVMAEVAAMAGGCVQAVGLWHLVLAGAAVGAGGPGDASRRAGSRRPAQVWGGALLESAGRNSLSLYLVHAMTFSVIFSAWGLGLATTSLPTMVLAAVAVWLVLAVAAALTARPWPAERLVRRTVPVSGRPSAPATSLENDLPSCSTTIPAPPGGTR